MAFICSLSLWYSHESRIKNLFAFSSCCCCCRWFNTNQPWPKFSHCRVGFVCFHIYFFSSHNYTRRELKKRKFCNTYNVNFFFLFSIWIARLTTPLYECTTIVNFFFIVRQTVFSICWWSSHREKEEVEIMENARFSWETYEWNRQHYDFCFANNLAVIMILLMLNFPLFFYIIAALKWVETFWMTTWVMHTNLCPYWRRLLHSMDLFANVCLIAS